LLFPRTSHQQCAEVVLVFSLNYFNFKAWIIAYRHTMSAIGQCQWSPTRWQSTRECLEWRLFHTTIVEVILFGMQYIKTRLS